MKMVAQALMLTLSIATLCVAQDSSDACDFSNSKPLIVSHALLNAAVKKVEPKYPGGGHLHVQGEVQVKILVDRKGNVVAACVTQGHPLLRASALKAAYEWKFKRNFGFSSSKFKEKYIQAFIFFNFKLE